MKTSLLSPIGICTAMALTLFFAGCGGGTNPIGCSGTGTNACVAPQFLYATAQKEILGFTVNPTSGALSAPTTTPGPVLIVGNLSVPSYGIVNAHGFVYVSDPSNNQVDGFSVNNTTGGLTPLSGSPFPLPGTIGLPEGMATDALGKFLYVGNAGTIDGFTIDSATGALTAIPGSPFLAGENLEVTVDPFGRFLFASDGQAPGGVLAFTIDPGSGSLTPVAGSPFALPVAGGKPVALAVDSSGSFVYTVLASLTSGYVAGFSIDATSGALTAVSGSPSFNGPLSPLAIATTGSFLYVSSGQAISVFDITSGTGVLTEISGSPFPADGAGGMAMAPNGKFLYETAAAAISVYAIDPASGAVSTSGNPVPAADGPLVLTYD
jgi:6-phosphogluconolactonase